MRFPIIPALLVLILMTRCDGNGPVGGGQSATTWETALGGAGDELALGVAVASDGSIVAVGSRGPGSDTDALMVMTDRQGSQLWEYVHDRTFPSVLNDADFASDGNIIAVGRQNQSVQEASMLVIKCDRSGNEIWKRVFPTIGFDEAHALIALDDGGCVICGTITTVHTHSRDLLAMRLTAAGEIVWRQFAGDSANQRGRDVVRRADGTFVVIGGSSISDVACQPILFHVNGDGDALASWTIPRSVNPVDISGTIFSGDNILLAMSKNRDAGEESDELFLLIDASGAVIWEGMTLDNNGTNTVYDIVGDLSGGAMAVGSTTSRSLGAQARDIHLVQIDAEPAIAGEQIIGHYSFDDGYAIAVHPDGGYVIAGATRSLGNGGVDVYLARTNGDGKIHSSRNSE